MTLLHRKSLFVLFFTIVSYLSFGQFKPAQYTDNNGVTINYQVLLPEDYNPANKYPIVLFLHGGGERGDDNTAQLKYGSQVWLELQKKQPTIVIAPQCPKDDYWASVKFTRDKYPLVLDFNYSYDETPSLHAAIDLLKSYIKEKKADKKRVYITGMSMGGMGTFEAVYRYPKLFAAAIPMCGGADLSMYGKKQAKVPFWIFHGDEDVVIPVKHSREAYAKLQELNANVTYTEYPGVNHNSWDKVFLEEQYPYWMFQFTR
ncbi:carboxylesterase family protein [Jiulongibacter sp. NS-SX5]|uniref:carboxylesterase family protein n=1 Tax=Jiulongibacter sp. NS-SX5 TaxID=3463854 RepID=UPI004058EFDD